MCEFEFVGDWFKYCENWCFEMRLRFWVVVGVSGFAREYNNIVNVVLFVFDVF